MGPLGYGVVFFIIVIMGLSGLGMSLSARIGRNQEARQLPLPLGKQVGFLQEGRRHTEWAWVFVGSATLVLLSGGIATTLGQLAIMSDVDAQQTFSRYPLLLSYWRPLMSVGPIICVVMTVIGMSLLSRSLERIGRRC